ncbi:MAG: purine-nucleoside/S-methyl-5-thioadenosine phosphorylase / adenosine deaminase [Mycobacteriales bacterium]
MPEARVRRVVTSRPGGVSAGPYTSFNLGGHVGDDPAAVAANRGRLAAAMDLPADRVVWMDQVHGTAVRVVEQPPTEPLAGTDAAVTAEPGLAVAVLVADCVPVLLGDAEAGVIAAVHAGRVGAAGGVLRRALESMWKLGAEPAHTEALLGPAICGNCYEVPAAMQAEVERVLPGSACPTRAGGTGLDLRAGLAAQLTALGVARVALDSRCTAEDPELFSYRRDGTTGRQAALIWLTR